MSYVSSIIYWSFISWWGLFDDVKLTALLLYGFECDWRNLVRIIHAYGTKHELKPTKNPSLRPHCPQMLKMNSQKKTCVLTSFHQTKHLPVRFSTLNLTIKEVRLKINYYRRCYKKDQLQAPQERSTSRYQASKRPATTRNNRIIQITTWCTIQRFLNRN